MKLTKISFLCFLFITLNGCMQNSALLGPAVTVAGTGNIYQATFSYGANHAITKTTGKSPMENFKEFLETDEKADEKEFFEVVKKKIRENSSIKDLTNQ